MDLYVQPVERIRGEVIVPGDKSISHRALMLAAIAQGQTTLQGLPDGADVRSTAGVLAQLGVQVTRRGRQCQIDGRGMRGLREPSVPLDCGNSGTTLRLMAGLLAGAGLRVTLTGDRSLRARPMERIAEPLRAMGAQVWLRDGTPPVRLGSGALRPVTYQSPVASAQVKSCVLLAGLYAGGCTRVLEPQRTRDHTERMLTEAGVGIRMGSAPVPWSEVASPSALRPLEGRIPGDISSAAYWVALAALGARSELRLPGVGLNPTRRSILELFQRWGAAIDIEDASESLGEPLATLRVRGGGTLRGGSIEPEQVVGLIDELPLLAAIAPFTREGVSIRGAAELRVKESDRIATTCAALRAVGVSVQEQPDGLSIAGGQRVRGGEIDAAGDHRIGLAFAVLGAASEQGVTIRGAEAMRVSYPRFFDHLSGVAET